MERKVRKRLIKRIEKLERRLDRAYSRLREAEEGINPIVLRAKVKEALRELDKWCNNGFCQEDCCYSNCPIANTREILKELNKRLKKYIKSDRRIYQITGRLLTLKWRDIRKYDEEDEDLKLEEVLEDGKVQ